MLMCLTPGCETQPSSFVNLQIGLLLGPPPLPPFSRHRTPIEDRHTKVTLRSLFEPHDGGGGGDILILTNSTSQERKAQGKGEDLEPKVVRPARDQPHDNSENNLGPPPPLIIELSGSGKGIEHSCYITGVKKEYRVKQRSS